MKRILLCAALFAASFTTVAQVGVGNTDPKATLDVTGDAADAASLDGIIAPRLTGAELRAKTYTADQLGAIVYATAADTAPAGQTVNVTEAGYYSFDGTEWVRFAAAAAPFTPAYTVYVDTADPNSATTYDEGVSPLVYDDVTMGCIANTNYVDDPTLADDTANLYVGHSGVCPDPNDGSQYSYWVYDGTDYVPFEASETTEWYLSPTTIDAGSNKTSTIKRDGNITVGEGFNGGDRFAILAGHYTSRNPRSAAISGNSLYASLFQNNHDGPNELTSLFGTGINNNNYSAFDMTNQYALTINNNHYGTGRLGSLRGINASATARTDSGAFTSGYGIVANLSNQSTSVDPITTFYTSSFSGTHTGAARITNARGANISMNASTASGSFNAGRGIEVTLTNSSPSTTAVSTMYGINANNYIRTAGKVNTAVGINVTANANSDSAGFNTGYGVNTSLVNDSPDATAIGAMYGVNNNVDAYAGGNVNNLRGISSSVVSNSDSGSFTTAHGIYNTFTAGSASTDAINTLYGAYHDVNHQAGGRVNNLRGANIDVSATAASGNVNNSYGIVVTLDNDSEDTTLITSTTAGRFVNTTYSAADVTSQRGLYITTNNGNTATHGGATHFYGIDNQVQYRTLNPGALDGINYTGINSAFSYTSVKNTDNFKGMESNLSITGDGGIVLEQTGIENNITNNSNSTDLLPTLRGIDTYMIFGSKQSVNNIDGTRSYVNITANATGGTIGNLVGVRSLFNYAALATSTIDNSYGFYFQNNEIPAENNYGLYLENVFGATTSNYAIYSAGGDSYFTDAIRIGNIAANGSIADGATTPVPDSGAGTMVFQGTNFYGWTGTEWKQLNN
jgi:hypothetical protein